MSFGAPRAARIPGARHSCGFRVGVRAGRTATCLRRGVRGARSQGGSCGRLRRVRATPAPERTRANFKRARAALRNGDRSARLLSQAAWRQRQLGRRRGTRCMSQPGERPKGNVSLSCSLRTRARRGLPPNGQAPKSELFASSRGGIEWKQYSEIWLGAEWGLLF